MNALTFLVTKHSYNKKKIKYFFNVVIVFIPVLKQFKIFERVNRCQVYTIFKYAV